MNSAKYIYLYVLFLTVKLMQFTHTSHQKTTNLNNDQITSQFYNKLKIGIELSSTSKSLFKRIRKSIVNKNNNNNTSSYSISNSSNVKSKNSRSITDRKIKGETKAEINNNNNNNNKRNNENSDTVMIYKNFFNMAQVNNNEARQYCGETLYYVVEYYCVYIKGTGVYMPDNDLESVSVISKREANENNYDSLAQNGIVDECCHRACRPSELDKYCN